jgi:hypothetical protein
MKRNEISSFGGKKFTANSRIHLFDHKTNGDILEELKMDSMEEKTLYIHK